VSYFCYSKKNYYAQEELEILKVMVGHCPKLQILRIPGMMNDPYDPDNDRGHMKGFYGDDDDPLAELRPFFALLPNASRHLGRSFEYN